MSGNMSTKYPQTFYEKGEAPVDLSNEVDAHLDELKQENIDLWLGDVTNLILDESKDSEEYKQLNLIVHDIAMNIRIKTESLIMAKDCIKGLQQINKWDQEHEKYMSQTIQRILK